MFLANDITKPWAICLKGDPIEVISARDKNAIIIKCKGQRLTVSQHDITDVNPLPGQPKLVRVGKKEPVIKEQKVPVIEERKVQIIEEKKVAAIEDKHPKTKVQKVSQPTMF